MSLDTNLADTLSATMAEEACSPSSLMSKQAQYWRPFLIWPVYQGPAGFSFFSPKRLFLSGPVDCADLVQFSKFERFEVLMNCLETRLCVISRTGESA